MHEFSLAEGLCEMILDIAVSNNADSVERVIVVVGKYSGLVEESFIMAFKSIASMEPVLNGAELVLERMENGDPVCSKCGAILDLSEMVTPVRGIVVCQVCGEFQVVRPGEEDVVLKSVDLGKKEKDHV